MNLYIKQKVFSWKDRFSIFDENQNIVYTAESEFLSLGKKLHVYDSMNRETAFIRQKLLSFLPKYYVCRNDVDIAEVVKRFTFKPAFDVNGLGWNVSGDFWAHEYSITSGSRLVAAVSKRWLTWGDTYEISIVDPADAVNVLCVVLIIDAIKADSDAAASSASY